MQPTTEFVLGCDQCKETFAGSQSKIWRTYSEVTGLEEDLVFCPVCYDEALSIPPTAGPLVEQDPTSILCKLYNDIVEPRTTLPCVYSNRLNLGVQNSMLAEWERHKGDLAVFRDAFESWADAEGMWSAAGVTLTKLWGHRPKSNGTWFAALVSGEFRTMWWLEPYRDDPLPKLADVLNRRAVETLRYGVDTKGQAITSHTMMTYCRRLKTLAKHLDREYRANLRANIEHARSEGIDDTALKYSLINKWEPNQIHGGLLVPMIEEELA